MLKFNDISICLVLCVVNIMLFGCKSQINHSELVGKYIVKYPYGAEELDLMPDGTYEQSYMPKNQTLKLINKDRWEIRSGDEFLLILSNPVIIDDGFGKISLMEKSSGYWPLRIKKGILGRIQLPVNEDLGFYFKQMKKE